MPDEVVLPGGRDVRGTLSASDASTCVVACPPHPQHGGRRSDSRLVAVADALEERSIACLRFDYGPWDEGRGERSDAENATEWARERYDGVALFGYSFGAAIALVAAARGPHCAVSALAPPDRVADLDAVAAIQGIEEPLQVLYGERDDTVRWGPVVTAARERNATVRSFPADHFFVGARERVGEAVAEFVVERC